MVDYYNSKIFGINPHWVLATGTKDGLGLDTFGLGTLGQTEPVRAIGRSIDSGIYLSDAEIAAGDSYEYETCLTEVFDWPFAEDEAGIAFDQSNLYGVRTICFNKNVDEGERVYLTAVPKALPTGYTSVGRCGRLVPLIDDYLGYDPMLGEDAFATPLEWELRYADGTLPNHANATTNAKIKKWRPMNLNQEVLTTEINNTMGFFYYNNSKPLISLTFPDGTTVSNTAEVWHESYLGTHIGCRGARITILFYADDYIDIFGANLGPFHNGGITIIVGHSEEDPVSPAFNDTEIYNQQHDISTFTYLGAGGGYAHMYKLEVFVGANLSPVGTAHVLSAYTGLYYAGTGGYYEVTIDWAPRTDVPLWYFSSTGNKCAPGGIPTIAIP